tara:strand:+ start:1297 stop:1587 length:291 start_codon:yes stop_codon:yes gene_type:complete
MKYETIFNCLTDNEILALFARFMPGNSRIFEHGELGHLVERETGRAIGYFGDDALELVDPQDSSLSKYHELFASICEYIVLEERLSESYEIMAPMY